VTAIAVQAGVSASTVSRATSVGGRFDTGSVDDETVRAWAARRRLGETVRAIAQQAGTSRTSVASLTSAYGPFRQGGPTDPATAGQWAQQRRQPVPVREIARRHGVSTSRVSQATRDLGPFPSPLQGPPATVSLRGIARMSRLSYPAICGKYRNGALPEPAGYGPRGWPYWSVDDIEAWVAASTAPACPQCGAKAERLDSHLLMRHPTPQAK
jgi:hypothetical protein